MTAERQFREPTGVERALLERLLEANFPARSELAVLLGNVLVKTIDDDGSLELESQVQGKAPILRRVPVEAEGKDEDGATIHMLLHVNEGRTCRTRMKPLNPIKLGRRSATQREPIQNEFSSSIVPAKVFRLHHCAASLIPSSDVGGLRFA